MLTEPTMQKLHELKLDALAQAWTQQQRDPHASALSFDERLGLLVDSQYLAVHNKRIQRALREAKLRICGASLKALDCPEKRNLDRAQLAQLAAPLHATSLVDVVLVGFAADGDAAVVVEGPELARYLQAG